MQVSDVARRQAFAFWLRTGRLPRIRAADGTECKFNPYHDEIGRFTTGPGGGVRGRQRSAGPKPVASGTGSHGGTAALAPAGSEPAVGRGSNSRAFEDPMTLDEAFPGLAGSPGGSIVAAADHMLDMTGPANRMMAGIFQDQSKLLIAQIKAIGLYA